jgi:hypothetical protein
VLVRTILLFALSNWSKITADVINKTQYESIYHTRKIFFLKYIIILHSHLRLHLPVISSFQIDIVFLYRLGQARHQATLTKFNTFK